MEEKLERVQKFIALSGFASRRKAEELIQENRVQVNGKTITIGDKCSKNDIITIDNKKINFNTEQNTYIVMNKKKGLVCSKSDELGRKTVFDALSKQDQQSNLFTVGRLDKNSSGLLLITNDGLFAQRIIHPSSKILKTYIATLDKNLIENDKKKLQEGITLEGYKLSKCIIEKIKPKLEKTKVETKNITNTQKTNILENNNNSNNNTTNNLKSNIEHKYIVKISEGRKRQIREMFKKLNYNVKDLSRIKIGNMDLKDLKLKTGEYKQISRNELEKMIFR